MATVEGLEMRKRLCCDSMERELHISRKLIQEFLKISKANDNDASYINNDMEYYD